MSGKENLINLKELDPEQAKRIRSLGGKARQEQRKKELALHNFFNDYFKITNYYTNELEKILASKPELNDYQKKTIKREFLSFIYERGYIRDSQLTDTEKESILINNELTTKDLDKFFKSRNKTKKRRSMTKRKPKAKTEQGLKL